MAEEPNAVLAALADQSKAEVEPEPEQLDENPLAEEKQEVEEAPAEKPASLTPKDLAEKLGISPKELYGALSIKLGDSEMSLGEIKDRAKELLVSDEKLAGAEKYKLDSENELMLKNQALAQAVKATGIQLSPQMLQQAQESNEQYGREQAAATLQAIPDWQDVAVQNSDYELIRATQAKYGFSEAEGAQMRDHRIVKLLRDFSQLNKRLEDAGQSEVRKSQNLGGKSRKRAAPQRKTAGDRFRSGELSQNSAIITAIADGAKT